MKIFLLFLPFIIFANYLDDYKNALSSCEDKICKYKIISNISSFYSKNDENFAKKINQISDKMGNLKTNQVFYLDKDIIEDIDFSTKKQNLDNEFLQNLNTNFVENCKNISSGKEEFCYIKSENLIFYSHKVIELLKAIEVAYTLCEKNNAKACFLVGAGLKKFGANTKVEFLTILDFYKKSCDLGYDFACEMEKLREKFWNLKTD